MNFKALIKQLNLFSHCHSWKVVVSWVRFGIALALLFKLTVKMELPNLGDHCALTSCSRLDFLPVKCGGCRKVFCGSHYPYSEHSCPSPSLGDARVPVCPLCDRPIPVRRKGDPPDLLVSQHIDTDCQSDPAKENRNKVFDQRCTFRKCKKKEMIRIVCDDCKSNFCLQHRHPKVQHHANTT